MIFKYYMTDTSKLLADGTKVFRIVAARDFGNVKKGTLGGWIERGENLSQLGDCWVADEAVVTGESVVSENAIVRGYVKVRGYSHVFGQAIVEDNADLSGAVYVYDSARVDLDSRLIEGACVCGNAIVSCVNRQTASGMGLAANLSGNAIVRGNAFVGGKASVRDYAIVDGSATISESARIYDSGYVGGDAVVRGQASVCGGGMVFGNVTLCDRAKVTGEARVAGHLTLSGRTIMSGWGMRSGNKEIRDQSISGDGSVTYERKRNKTIDTPGLSERGHRRNLRVSPDGKRKPMLCASDRQR